MVALFIVCFLKCDSVVWVELLFLTVNEVIKTEFYNRNTL